MTDVKQYDSRVVADNFRFGADRNIIVALEHNVVMANRKDMAKVGTKLMIKIFTIVANTCFTYCPRVSVYSYSQDAEVL